MNTLRWSAPFLVLAVLCAGCTIPLSKQALTSPSDVTPADDASFLTEEDSGLSLFGLVNITEPDHYAVLLERARRRNHCRSIHHAQLDYYLDHWIIVAFPIARVTLICDNAVTAEAGEPKAGL